MDERKYRSVKRGKRDRFSRIARLEITIPPSANSVTVEIVRDRQAMHRIIGPPEVKFDVTYRDLKKAD